MKPIIFSQDSIRAILEDRKTMTRRVVKTTAVKMYRGTGGLCGFFEDRPIGDRLNIIKPPHQPGDILYVKESWMKVPNIRAFRIEYLHKAACSEKDLKAISEWPGKWPWKSSRYMPKEAARIFLRVTDVLRAEQVQEIMNYEPGPNNPIVLEGVDYGCDFIALWDRINAKRGYGWDKNPWVWVIKFKRITKEDAMKEAI